MEKDKQARDGGKSKSRKNSSVSRSKRRIDARSYVWEVEPDVVRVVHGVPHQLESIKAFGNSVVPNQAKLAFEILMGVRK